MSYFFFPELEQFVDPLRATCTLKVKANSVKQEYEKQDELKRSALRAVAALLQIPKAGMTQYFKILNHRIQYRFQLMFPDKNQHLAEFLSLIRSSSELQPLFESVQKDSSVLASTNADSLSMDQS